MPGSTSLVTVGTKRTAVSIFLILLLLQTGCSADNGHGSNDTSTDEFADPDVEDFMDEDPMDEDPMDEDPVELTDTGDVPDGPVTRTPPADILQAGTADALLLRGTVLAPDQVLDPGDVLIQGDTITCVAADCTSAPGASDATWIDTHGIISPGLIDAHNHLAYNFLPEWIPDPPGTLFQNRYEWADLPDYEEFIAPYANHRSTGTHFCPAAKWGELRSLIHATTTVQGQSYNQGCVDWAVRNADHHHNLGYDHMHTDIGSVRDITDADAADLMAAIDDPIAPVTRFAVHMAEGYAGNHVDEEFDSFAGRDPRSNRHAGTSLLHRGSALLIHCVPLSEAQLLEVLETDSKIVWSPSSNMVLYGVTAPIQRIIQLGITMAIAPDWTPSGEDEMLSEMRFGYRYGMDHGIPEITPELIWKWATSGAAEVVGLEDRIGRLEAGYVADIAVFGIYGPDPYLALMESRARDVRLVLIGGEGWFGDANLQAATAYNDLCEAFLACEMDKYICVRDPTVTSRGDETLEDIRLQLYNILEGIGYPPEEQYGRGEELLPLVDCAL
jgi:5-methylthioadenosine/S-adenosylhomocysteine deaminase